MRGVLAVASSHAVQHPHKLSLLMVRSISSVEPHRSPSRGASRRPRRAFLFQVRPRNEGGVGRRLVSRCPTPTQTLSPHGEEHLFSRAASLSLPRRLSASASCLPLSS